MIWLRGGQTGSMQSYTHNSTFILLWRKRGSVQRFPITLKLCSLNVLSLSQSRKQYRVFCSQPCEVVQSCQSADSERQKVTFHGSDVFVLQKRRYHLGVNTQEKSRDFSFRQNHNSVFVVLVQPFICLSLSVYFSLRLPQPCIFLHHVDVCLLSIYRNSVTMLSEILFALQKCLFHHIYLY